MTSLAAGLRVAEDALVGRVLVATRAFAAGEQVLQEAPLLVWRTGDDQDAVGNLVRAFRLLSASQQELVLASFSRPRLGEASDRVRLRLEDAAEHAALCSPAGPVDVEELAQLLLIADINAHAFYGDLEVGKGFVAHGVPQAALFLLASKAAHACRPNCAWSTQAGGLMRYTALSDVQPGDHFTISYIAGELLPRAARRAQLLDEKLFECRCARCAGQDDCRGLRCHCGGVAFQSDEPEDMPFIGWACATCGAVPERWMRAQLVVEAQLLTRLDALCGDDCALAPHERLAALARMAAALEAALSPTHHLTGRAHTHAAALGLQLAGQAKPPSVAFFACSAAAGFLAAVRIRECVAAGCTGGASCAAPHEPVSLHPLEPRRVLEALGARDGALADGLRRLGRRYLPKWRALRSVDDEDVALIEALVQ